jgi:hypothetical protein
VSWLTCRVSPSWTHIGWCHENAYALIGEPSQDAAIAFQALDLSRDTGTRVITDELRKLTAWSQFAPLNDALDSMERTSTTWWQGES